MAALNEGTITDTTSIRDCVSIEFPNPLKPDEPYVFRNWRVDLGVFDLKRAIADSCNIFFFAVGGGHGRISGLGIERIASYLSRAGAEMQTGIDIPGENSGLVPTPVRKQRDWNEPWYLGDTYNVSIGQGDLLVTPIWINTYVSAIANGGAMMQPRIAKEIFGRNGVRIREISSAEIRSLPFRAEVIGKMKDAMRETVLTGTAKLLQNLPVSAGAKTGTAEVIKGKSVNSIFTAFAPFESPDVAITVLVEGVDSGQGYAIQIADRVLQWYFSEYRKSTMNGDSL